MTDHEEQIEKLRERLKEAADTLKVANDELYVRRIRNAGLETAIAVSNGHMRHAESALEHWSDAAHPHPADIDTARASILRAIDTTPATALALVIAALKFYRDNWSVAHWELTNETDTEPNQALLDDIGAKATAALASLGVTI